MKTNTFFVLLVVAISFLAGGCAQRNPSHHVTYGVAHPNSWVNPERQKPTTRVVGGRVNINSKDSYQESFDDLSDEPIECLLPRDKKPTVVYSERLCKQLIWKRKIQINREAMKKVSLESKFRCVKNNGVVIFTKDKEDCWSFRTQIRRKPSLEEKLKKVRSNKAMCKELKSKDPWGWCNTPDCPKRYGAVGFCKMLSGGRRFIGF